MNTNMKILVVDDFATMRKVVRNILRQLGFGNISEADNGEVAFNLAKNGSFDLIVSDWNMPVMTGIDFLRAIRANEKTKAIPFLLVTAESLKENIIEAMKAGASNYIVKPFTPDTFQEKLDAIFKTKVAR